MERLNNRSIKYLMLVLNFFLFSLASTSAQEIVNDTLIVFFRQSIFNIDAKNVKTGGALPVFVERNNLRLNDSTFILKNIKVEGAASPEGSFRFNETLSHRRALTVSNYLKKNLLVGDTLFQTIPIGVDWEGLKSKIMSEESVPNREQLMLVLQNTNYDHNERLLRLKQINNSIPYRWIYKSFFPQLRYSRVIVSYEVKPSFSTLKVIDPLPKVLHDTIDVVKHEKIDTIKNDNTIIEPFVEKSDSLSRRYLRWALKSNALYDVALIPNIGVEIYLGKQWSISANWMYAWWKNENKNFFWRIYGGELEFRRWFGNKSINSLQGHHIGLYGQMVTYDFCLGGRGYLGDKWTYGAGLSYGYSLPIAKRFNLDFSIGLGYLSGEYKEYLPIEGHYVWQLTRNKQWWGPTKAEISLVWLLGVDNANLLKGGKQ